MRLPYIAVFGLLGVFSRYLVGVTITRHIATAFPLGTFAINMTGAFAIGIVYVLGVEQAVISEDLRIGIMVGYLGGFTTFSSYCLETVRLLETGRLAYAALYAGLSNLLGLAAALGGMALTRSFFFGR